MAVVKINKEDDKNPEFKNSQHRFDNICSNLSAYGITFKITDISKCHKNENMRVQCIPITQMGTSNYTICMLSQNEKIDLHKVSSVINSTFVMDYIWKSEYAQFTCDEGNLTPLLQKKSILIAIDNYFSDREKTKEMMILLPSGKKNIMLEMKISDMITFLEKNKISIFFGDIKKRS